jgi:hypothetical protein
MNTAEEKDNLKFSIEPQGDMIWDDSDSSGDLSVLIKKQKKCYFSIIEHFNDICLDLKTQNIISVDILKQDIVEFISLFREDDRMFLSLANAPYSYVYKILHRKIYGIIVIHGINTMIYSLKIALALGVPEKRLPYICFAAIFRCLHLIELSEDELILAIFDDYIIEKISHSENISEKYLRKIQIDGLDFETVIKLTDSVNNIHSGMPAPNLDPNISQYAFIIYLCNEFEKLTHLHSSGKQLSPVDAMKKLRDEMIGHFNSDIIKIFFNNLSIYPLGTYVKLSSGEIAKIIEINLNSLLRPVIMIITDAYGKRKKQPVKINLREKPNLYIRKPVVNEELTEEYMDLL